MKKTLYLKFILAYFIFGVFGFIIVTTFVPNMTKEHLIREKAESLYSEATLIAGTYAGGLYTSETTLETVKMQLDSLAVYLNSEIRIINPSGRLVLDTNSPLDVENVVVIENFDSTVTSGSYYIVGDFFGNFDSFNTMVMYFSCISGGIVPSSMASRYPLIEVRGERKSWDTLATNFF